MNLTKRHPKIKNKVSTLENSQELDILRVILEAPGINLNLNFKLVKKFM